MTKREGDVLLTKLELEVAQVVWDSQPSSLTVREVVGRINQGRAKPLAYNTVLTMMTILKDKGVLVASPGPGRAHLYAASLSREKVSTSMVGDLVERLFEGSSQALLLQLIREESLSREELSSLRDWIDQRLEDEEEGVR